MATQGTQAHEEACDVAIIGGGPAGSTAAALLARKGYKVTVLEKARHPRFHIGESLLPMNLPIFDRLGVADKLPEVGVFKPGADFEADNAKGYVQFDFSRALGDSPPHAWQVHRERFDTMLFKHAAENGADMREGHKVTAVDLRAPREAVLDVEPENDAPYRLQARYLLDASGRDAMLSKKRGMLRRNKHHQSAAMFGRFRGVRFREPPHAGNISIYRIAKGWMWMIPQPDGIMSVGAVCGPAHMRNRRGDTYGFFMRTLQSNPDLWARMQGAELIDDKIHMAGNYSYDSSCIGGPGWLLIGDAFSFLDPVFSSGVYLAMTTGENAANLVDESLREPQREAALQQATERRLRDGMARFSWYVQHFNTTAMERMFRDPRNYFGVESAMISMLSGDVFDNRQVNWRLYLFRFFYLLENLRAPRTWWRERRERKLQARATLA